MIKIALCDDDSQFVSKITGLIQSLLQDGTDSPVITTYINPTTLTDAISDGERYDVYILDVEMPEQNGLEVAKRIREFQPNAPLLFLSSHLSYATEGYKVQALRYVPKLDLEKRSARGSGAGPCDPGKNGYPFYYGASLSELYPHSPQGYPLRPEDAAQRPDCYGPAG